SSSVVVYRSLVFFLMLPPPPRSTLFPYTTLFRSISQAAAAHRLAMRFLAKADDQLNQVHGYNPNAWSAHSVEAARLAHAAGKLRSEEHTSELQSLTNLVCRLLLEKKKNNHSKHSPNVSDAQRGATIAAAGNRQR